MSNRTWHKTLTVLAGLLRCLELGGRLQGIQVYTVDRPTPEAEARPLKAAGLDAVADQIRARLPSLNVEVLYGPEDWPI